MSRGVSTTEKFAALLRVGMAAAVAYRGEFFVWILTTNLPLVMLALWTRVAADAPVGGFTSTRFTAYFLGVLVVRFLTGSWVVWELTWEIREGALGPRLLRPMHPFVHYATTNLAQIPMRLVVCAPLAAVFASVVGWSGVTHDPVQWALWPLTLAGAWSLTFNAMLCVASLAFYFDSALSVWELWMALGYVLSGYVVPLQLLPAWAERVTAWLPWRYTLALPLETALGLTDRAGTLHGLAAQWAWVLSFFVASQLAWRRGVRRFEAFGG